MCFFRKRIIFEWNSSPYFRVKTVSKFVQQSWTKIRYCLLPFRGRAACISNKIRAAYRVFYFYLRGKNLSKQSVDCIWRKKSIKKIVTNKHQLFRLFYCHGRSIENSNIHNSNKTLYFIILFFWIQKNVIKKPTGGLKHLNSIFINNISFMNK